MATVTGSTGADLIYGTAPGGTLLADDGNDTVYGLGWFDYIDAGLGSDYVETGTVRAEVLGQDGNDTIIASAGRDTLSGGTGNDSIFGRPGNDDIHGDDGAPHTTAFRFPTIASEFEGAAKTGPVSRLLKNSIVAPDLPTETTPVDWLAGASVLMRRSVLDQVGLFDESFFLYFEETDLCLRAARAGWPTVYVVESRVMHLGSVSTGMKEWRRVPGYWFASRRHYFQKNHGRLYALAATLAHVAGLGLYGLRVLVQRKKPHTPPYFLRDLVKHEWGTRRPQES